MALSVWLLFGVWKALIERAYGKIRRPERIIGNSYLGITSRLPVTRPIARRSGTITGGRLRDEPSRNRSQTLWHGQHSRRKFRPDMHVQADRYGKGRALWLALSHFAPHGREGLGPSRMARLGKQSPGHVLPPDFLRPRTAQGRGTGLESGGQDHDGGGRSEERR